MTQGANESEEGIGLVLPDESSELRERWLWSAVLVLLALVAFSPAMQAGYIWDDLRYPLNPVLDRGADGLADVWLKWSSPATETSPGTYVTPQWYPMTFTTFWVERQLWGFNPMGYHAHASS